MSHAFYVVSSGKITNAMETVAGRIISNCKVIRKALFATILAPYDGLILLAGEEEPHL
jgi:hypothetical protein